MITANGTERGLTAWNDGPAKLPVKVDTRGRLHLTKEQQGEVLAAFAKSGESLPRFARRVGLKYSTIARWVQSAGRSRRIARRPKVRLFEAVVESPSAPVTKAMLVHLAGGVHLEVANEPQARLAAILLQHYAKPC